LRPFATDLLSLEDLEECQAKRNALAANAARNKKKNVDENHSDATTSDANKCDAKKGGDAINVEGDKKAAIAAANNGYSSEAAVTGKGSVGGGGVGGGGGQDVSRNLRVILSPLKVPNGSNMLAVPPPPPPLAQQQQPKPKAAIKVINKYGETQLHINCRKGYVKAVSDTLSKCTLEVVNARDHNGWTPLHEAIAYGQAECVQLLLKYRSNSIKNFFQPSSSSSKKNGSSSIGTVDLWAEGGEDRLTPLHDAVQCGHFAIVSMILDALIKTGSGLERMLEQKTASGNSVIDLAAANPDMKLFIDNKVAENKKKKQQTDEKSGGKTPAALAPAAAGTSSDSQLTQVKFLPSSSPTKYLLLCAAFLYKYTACLGLHVTRFLMKSSRSQQPLAVTFADERDPRVFDNEDDEAGGLAAFSVVRSDLGAAEDIKTAWSHAKTHLGGNAAVSLLAKFQADEIQ